MTTGTRVVFRRLRAQDHATTDLRPARPARLDRHHLRRVTARGPALRAPTARGATIHRARPEPPAHRDLLEHLRRMAKDLMVLEVNTIIRANMTAARLPPPAHALLDIAKEYRIKLADIINRYGLSGLRELASPDARGADDLWPIEGPGEPEASAREFDRLRTIAHLLARELSARIGQPAPDAPAGAARCSEADALMACRVRDNADQIKGVFAGLDGRAGFHHRFTRTDAPYVDLRPEEVVTVRKIWEIGTEEIAMQTVISLDGDVITRMQPHLTHPEGRGLVEIHNAAIHTSTSFWGLLVGTLGAFAASVGRLLVQPPLR